MLTKKSNNALHTNNSNRRNVKLSKYLLDLCVLYCITPRQMDTYERERNETKEENNNTRKGKLGQIRRKKKVRRISCKIYIFIRFSNNASNSQKMRLNCEFEYLHYLDDISMISLFRHISRDELRAFEQFVCDDDQIFWIFHIISCSPNLSVVDNDAYFGNDQARKVWKIDKGDRFIYERQFHVFPQCDILYSPRDCRVSKYELEWSKKKPSTRWHAVLQTNLETSEHTIIHIHISYIAGVVMCCWWWDRECKSFKYEKNSWFSSPCL